MAGLGDVQGADDFLLGEGGPFESGEGERICGAKVAAGDFIEGLEGPFIEGELLAPGDRTAVLEILEEFVAGEQAQAGVIVDAACHGLLVVAVEDGLELGLTAHDEAEDEAAVHLEVGQQPDQSEGIAAEVLSFIEKNDWASALVDRILEALLESAHQEEIGAGGRRTASGGDSHGTGHACRDR